MGQAAAASPRSGPTHRFGALGNACRRRVLAVAHPSRRTRRVAAIAERALVAAVHAVGASAAGRHDHGGL